MGDNPLYYIKYVVAASGALFEVLTALPVFFLCTW